MTAMSADIHRRIDINIMNGKIDGLLFTEILYADDTLIFLERTRETSMILQEIKAESKYYNMNLYKDKCEVIAMNKDNAIEFSDGTPLKHVGEATHLGGKSQKTPIRSLYFRTASRRACLL